MTRPSPSCASVLVSVLLASIVHLGCSAKLYPHPALVEGEAAHATLVIIRERNLQGSASAASVYLDRDKLVRLRSGTYAELPVAPGRYDLHANADVASFGFAAAGDEWMAGVRDLDAQAGETYYVIVQIAGGGTG